MSGDRKTKRAVKKSGWGVGKGIKGAESGKAPVVSLRRTAIRITAIHFATPRHGSTAFHYIYFDSDRHPVAPGNLKGWSIGSKIEIPEWRKNGKKMYPACFTRRQPISMSVKLAADTPVQIEGELEVTPTLDKSTRRLKPAIVYFTYPANSSHSWVDVTTGGAMPDEVGRYKLRLSWKVKGKFKFRGPEKTEHTIYSTFGQPLDAEHDTSDPAGKGKETSRDEGTMTGTPKRLDHLMKLIGKDSRHAVASQSDLVDLYWNLHKGLNDTPDKPPFFSAEHDAHMTVDGTRTGTKLALYDQWLALVPNSKQWNTCSCIGHVQLAKTMLAAIGLFARRAWVFPHTLDLPDGTRRTDYRQTDHLCLGVYDPRKIQTWRFTHEGKSYLASLVLMEPASFQNFEACMLSPEGKFLTGGYETSRNPQSFRDNKGFDSASELLNWWAASTYGKKKWQRFQCWVYFNRTDREFHAWDVTGTHYPRNEFEKIRDFGLQVPPP